VRNTEPKPLVLDRPHPFFDGEYIAVNRGYIKTVFALRDQVDAFRHQIGPCPEQADIDKAAWLLAPVIESAIVQKPIDPLVHRFTYHPPTDAKKQVYSGILRQATHIGGLVAVLRSVEAANATHQEIGDRCLAFAQLIERVCPNNRERAQAIDAVAMARMLLNEARVHRCNAIAQDIVETGSAHDAVTTDYAYRLLLFAEQRLVEARMLACASVAV